jgi:hypothetical protein
MPAVRVVDEHLLAPVLVYSGTGGAFKNELQLDTQGGIVRQQIGELLVVKNDFSVVASVTGSVFTGPVTFLSGAMGSIQALSDGSPFIRSGNGIEITSGADGSITVSASGTILTIESLSSTSSVFFGGDVYVEGRIFGGSPVEVGNSLVVTGSVIAQEGLSGSLTALSDGSPYLIAGSGISLSTGSSGQITISSTADPSSFGKNGSSGLLTELVLNEIPSGAMDGLNKTFTLAFDPANSASVMLWLNGQLLTQGALKDYTVSGRNILFGQIDLDPSDVIIAMYTRSVSVKKFSFNELASFITVSGSLALQIEKDPDPVQSLMIFRNGQLLTQNTDYSILNRQIQLPNGAIENDDIFLATYSYTE